MNAFFSRCIFCLFLLSSSRCHADPNLEKIPVDFHLNFSVIRQENSQDSNTRETTVSLKENRLDYEWNYDGYSANPVKPMRKKLKLTGAQMLAIIDIVKQNKLLVSVRETHQTHCLGDAFIAYLDVTLSGVSAHIQLKGMVNVIQEEFCGKELIVNQDQKNGIKKLEGFFGQIIAQ